jgi:Pectinesterase/Bacterial Ig-like domain
MAGRMTRKEFLQATGVVAGGLLASTAGAVSARRAAAASVLAPVALTPTAGAQQVCVDTPLTIAFNQAPRVGTSGRIRVVRADGTVVDTIDVSAATQSRVIGTAPTPFNYHPVIVTGSTAAITLHQALAYGQTYHVLVDPGVFLDASGTPFAGISDPNAWRFQTKPAGPAVGTTTLTVAADGTGDFCTVQGAIDFVPAGNAQRVHVQVRPGTYTEIVYVGPTRTMITVLGLDRAGTVVQYANNNNLNGAVTSSNRALFGVDAADFALQTITLHNTTPEGGSQAEAFRGSAQRVMLDRVTLRSRQDTLRLQGAAFVTNSYIEGDVDFTWGNGGVFFNACEIRALHRTVASSTDIFAQVRNGQSNHGNVYLGCQLTGPDLTAADTVFLARIDPTRFPFSQVVYLGCAMNPRVPAAGWQLNNATTAPNVQFWEHRSTDLAGHLLDVSGRAAFSRQLTDAQTAQWSSPAFVLGWSPPATAP